MHYTTNGDFLQNVKQFNDLTGEIHFVAVAAVAGLANVAAVGVTSADDSVIPAPLSHVIPAKGCQPAPESILGPKGMDPGFRRGDE